MGRIEKKWRVSVDAHITSNKRDKYKRIWSVVKFGIWTKAL